MTTAADRSAAAKKGWVTRRETFTETLARCHANFCNHILAGAERHAAEAAERAAAAEGEAATRAAEAARVATNRDMYAEAAADAAARLSEATAAGDAYRARRFGRAA